MSEHRPSASEGGARHVVSELTVPAASIDRSTVGGAVLAYLDLHRTTLSEGLAALASGGDTRIHHTRVAGRRMRSALQEFEAVFDPETARAMRAELKWLAGELAPARDLDVIGQRLHEELHRLDDDLVVGPVRALLVEHLASARQEAVASAHAVVTSERCGRLLEALESFCATPPFEKMADKRAKKRLTRVVSRAFRRFERRLDAADLQPAGPSRDAALHEARKRAKRLRYALEVAAPTVGPRAKKSVRVVRRMQQALGEHQDSAVARPFLRRLGMRVHLTGANGFTFGVLHARQAEAARVAEARVAELRPGIAKARSRWAR